MMIPRQAFILSIILFAPFPVNAQTVLSPSANGSCNNLNLLGKSLPVNLWPQDGGSRCWAASARITMQYVRYRKINGLAPTQCEMINTIDNINTSVSTCCDPVYGDSAVECKKPHFPEDALDKFRFSYAPPRTNPDRLDDLIPLNFDQVKEEICNERPYISAIAYIDPATQQAGEHHAVVVHGYLDLRSIRIRPPNPLLRLRLIRVYDPLENTSFWDVERFGSYGTSPNTYNHHGDTHMIKDIPLPVFFDSPQFSK